MIDFSQFGFINFKTLKENWNAFELDDGSIILLKIVVIKMSQLEEREESFGLRVNSRDIIGILSKPELHGEPSYKKHVREELEASIIEEDIGFKQIKGSWNEYKLENGHTFYLKPILTMASRTDRFNENGEPIYLIQSQVLSKRK
jgi:hypothetical protein